MPTKRTRVSRNIIPNISETALWVLGDRILYPKPESVNKWELIAAPGLDFPTCAFKECKAVWDPAKDPILQDWIRKFPGTRCSWWWLFDAPRLSAEEAKRHEWDDSYFLPQICEPRKRISGSGIPAHEIEGLVPEFDCGIPVDWRETDPRNPPTFESQAEYLRRHDLLTPEEKRRLKQKDFEPEKIELESELELTSSVQ